MDSRKFFDFLEYEIGYHLLEPLGSPSTSYPIKMKILYPQYIPWYNVVVSIFFSIILI